MWPATNYNLKIKLENLRMNGQNILNMLATKLGGQKNQTRRALLFYLEGSYAKIKTAPAWETGQKTYSIRSKLTHQLIQFSRRSVYRFTARNV